MEAQAIIWAVSAHLSRVPFLPVTPTIPRKKKKWPLYILPPYVRIPCAPNTVCKVQGKPHILQYFLMCYRNWVRWVSRFLNVPVSFYERSLRFRALKIMRKYTNRHLFFLFWFWVLKYWNCLQLRSALRGQCSRQSAGNNHKTFEATNYLIIDL